MTTYDEIADLFKDHDKDYVRGGFGHVSAKVVEEWEEADELRWVNGDKGEILGAAHVLQVKNRKKIEDFAGTHCAWVQPGDVHIKRVAFRDEERFNKLMNVLSDAYLTPQNTIWVEEFVEYRDAMDYYPLSKVCTKVRGDSSMISVYALSPRADRIVAETSRLDHLTLEKLRMEIPEEQVDAAVSEMKTAGIEWADHYSSYNVAHTWKAITLRGYGGREDFIIKPSEMSKKWKEENSEKMAWDVEDTEIRASLPAAEPLISLIPGKKHRVRLMLLKAGSELLRHSDITDPDAGTADYKLLRIHIPLVTNKDCKVLQWRLDGSLKEENLKVGEAWYLDTRKPHAVKNGGKSDRVHLVMDVESSPELRAILGIQEDQKSKMEAWI